MSLLYQIRKRLRSFRKAVGPGGVKAYRSMVMPFWRFEARRAFERRCANYIAVGGSCGKSTTTMLIGALVGAQRPTAAGVYSNTERHTLRFIRKLDRKVDYFVQEVSEFPMGTIGNVAKTFPIGTAVVTSVGLDHFVVFRTHERAAEEIGGLVSAVPEGGLVCLNADDPHVRGMARRAKGRTILFGRAADAELRAENVNALRPAGLEFELVIGERRYPVRTQFTGTLMLPNVLGALAVVYGLGLDVGRAVADLAATEPLGSRMRAVPAPDGHTYLVDSKKAPLWSTRMLVDDLPNMTTGRRILVLGEVSDTGSDGSRKMRQLIRNAATKCDLVIGVSAAASAAEKLTRVENLPNVRAARHLGDVAEILRKEAPALVVLKGNDLIPRGQSLQSKGLGQPRPEYAASA